MHLREDLVYDKHTGIAHSNMHLNDINLQIGHIVGFANLGDIKVLKKYSTFTNPSSHNYSYTFAT